MMVDIEKQHRTQESKKILLEIRDLFEDLKAARSGTVRSFIFDNLYKFLGTVETTIDSLLSHTSELENELSRRNAEIASERRMTKWINEARDHFTREEIALSKEAAEFSAEDKRVDQLSTYISGEEDLDLPEAETSAYVGFTSGRNLCSIKPIGDLREGDLYGTLFYDEKKAEMMPVFTAASASTQMLTSDFSPADEIDPSELSTMLAAPEKLNGKS